MSSKKMYEGQFGWAHHPRGGVIIDIIGKEVDMDELGIERKLGPYGFPKSQVHHLDSLPRNREVYSVAKRILRQLGFAKMPKNTSDILNAWLTASAK